MVNRIASLLSDPLTEAPSHAPELDWSVLHRWLPVLDPNLNDEAALSAIDPEAVREAFRQSGILIWDGPAWAQGEGGLMPALERSLSRNLTYLRNALSALYYADFDTGEHIPAAIIGGWLFSLVRRAHTLVTTMQVLEELITGELTE